MPGTTSTALPSFSHDQHHKTDVAKRKGSKASQTPSWGRGTAEIQSAGDGHYLYLQTQFGEDQCMQFRVIMVTDPQTPAHPHTDRTDYNTLRCS